MWFVPLFFTVCPWVSREQRGWERMTTILPIFSFLVSGEGENTHNFHFPYSIFISILTFFVVVKALTEWTRELIHWPYFLSSFLSRRSKEKEDRFLFNYFGKTVSICFLILSLIRSFLFYVLLLLKRFFYSVTLAIPFNSRSSSFSPCPVSNPHSPFFSTLFSLRYDDITWIPTIPFVRGNKSDGKVILRMKLMLVE